MVGMGTAVVVVGMVVVVVVTTVVVVVSSVVSSLSEHAPMARTTGSSTNPSFRNLVSRRPSWPSTAPTAMLCRQGPRNSSL